MTWSIHPTNLWLTIHESGRPLDRAGSRALVGSELTRARASSTPDKTGKLTFGSHARQHRRATVRRPAAWRPSAYDDDGVPAQRWYSGQGRHLRRLADDARAGAADRAEDVARLPERRYRGRACRSRGCRTCRSSLARQDTSTRSARRRRRERHFDLRRRQLVDRSAALQLPVRRPDVLGNQQRQGRWYVALMSRTSRARPTSGARATASADALRYQMNGSFVDGKESPAR